MTNKIHARIKGLREEIERTKKKGQLLSADLNRIQYAESLIAELEFAQAEILKTLNKLEDVKCHGMTKEFIKGSNWCNHLWRLKIEGVEKKVKNGEKGN